MVLVQLWSWKEAIRISFFEIKFRQKMGRLILEFSTFFYKLTQVNLFDVELNVKKSR